MTDEEIAALKEERDLYRDMPVGHCGPGCQRCAVSSKEPRRTFPVSLEAWNAIMRGWPADGIPVAPGDYQAPMIADCTVAPISSIDSPIAMQEYRRANGQAERGPSAVAKVKPYKPGPTVYCQGDWLD